MCGGGGDSVKRGGWCCLGDEVSVFVVVVVGDSSWRTPLLFRSIYRRRYLLLEF